MTYVVSSGRIPVCFITPDCARAATGIINKSTAKSADNAACFFPECMFLPPLLRSSLRRQAICRTEHFCGQRGPFFYRRGLRPPNSTFFFPKCGPPPPATGPFGEPEREPT